MLTHFQHAQRNSNDIYSLCDCKLAVTLMGSCSLCACVLVHLVCARMYMFCKIRSTCKLDVAAPLKDVHWLYFQLGIVLTIRSTTKYLVIITDKTWNQLYSHCVVNPAVNTPTFLTKQFPCLANKFGSTTPVLLIFLPGSAIWSIHCQGASYVSCKEDKTSKFQQSPDRCILLLYQIFRIICNW